MPASYPTSIRTFTNKVDLVDTVLADHVNALQDEVRALEINIGTGIKTATFTGTFATTATWDTLSDRIANIEAGLVNGTGLVSPYVKKVGDSIQPPSGTVGLIIKTTAGSANLFEARSSSNTLGFNVDSSGTPKMGTAAILYVGSTEYNTLTNTATAALATAEAVRFDPFLLAGM